MRTSAPNPVADLDATFETTQSKEGVLRVTSGSESGQNNSSTYRTDFLASFTHDEEKKIIRKVDFRILVLFGLIYMIKQVWTGPPG